ncbi:hypothetical protein AMTR_s00007p00179040 [Amborella trichopoda]|uniref:Protein kinase domain-containing protein n=1 Tax=Amborella trichopoda TaxID=13333 RepID=W1PE48_AMBTC|nr:hypothetical protein AMTR_s00007p00179040 [Amborella trichopoda]
MAAIGEAHALHVHDLLCVLLALELCSLDETKAPATSYRVRFTRLMADFAEEMASLSRTHEVFSDKKHLVLRLQAKMQKREKNKILKNLGHCRDEYSLASSLYQKLERGYCSPSSLHDHGPPQIEIRELKHRTRKNMVSWLGVKVSIKELSFSLYETVKNEVFRFSLLQNPFLVQIFGISFDGDRCYLVMEILNSDFSTQIQGKSMTLEAVINCLLQISRAMEYLHSQKTYIQVDLSASNVMFEPSAIKSFREEGYGRVKLLCKFEETKCEKTSGFQREKDVYSFGVLWSQVLQLQKQRNSSSSSSCPSLVWEYLQRCLQKEAQARPSFGEISRFLRYVKLLLLRTRNPETIFCLGVRDFDKSHLECFFEAKPTKNQLLISEKEEENPQLLENHFMSSEKEENTLLENYSVVYWKEEKTHLMALDWEEEIETKIEENQSVDSQRERGKEGKRPTKMPVNRCKCIVKKATLKAINAFKPEKKLKLKVPDYIRRFSYQELKEASQNFTLQTSQSTWEATLQDQTCLTLNKPPNPTSFTNQALIFSTIHHPNILRLRGLCAAGPFLAFDRSCIVGTIHDLIFSPEGLTWVERRRVVAGIARALAHLHRNCSPRVLGLRLDGSTVFLDRRFAPRFGGFEGSSRGSNGWARKWEEEDEQGKNVYNFGVLVVEILMGRRWGEMAHGDFYELQERVVDDGVMGLVDERVRKEVEDEKEVLCMGRVGVWCMAKDVGKRLCMEVAAAAIEGAAELPPPVFGTVEILPPALRLRRSQGQQG